MAAKAKPKPTSLRAYARHRGVSPESVSKAVFAGRLRDSVVTIGGQPKIGDVDLADREWEANTAPRADRDIKPPNMRDDGLIPDYNESRALREMHAARRESALADLAEIEVARELEEIVPASEARAIIVDRFTTVKTRILGVPTLFAQRLPHLAAEAEPVLDELLRAVLEDLAAETSGDGKEEDAPA